MTNTVSRCRWKQLNVRNNMKNSI